MTDRSEHGGAGTCLRKPPSDKQALQPLALKLPEKLSYRDRQNNSAKYRAWISEHLMPQKSKVNRMR
jgi:hypothetical protein